MKKLMSVLLGLSLMLGAATVSFAADPPCQEGKEKESQEGQEGREGSRSSRAK